jgi:hypothetical protein
VGTIGTVDPGDRWVKPAPERAARAADDRRFRPSTNVHASLDGARTLRAMGRLLESIGDGITGLVGGALHAALAAVQGIGSALVSAIPGGIMGVVAGLAAVVVIVWLLRR